MENNARRNVVLSIVGVALLVVAVVGVSFAFFSYYGAAGEANTVQTGQIYFSASQDTLSLTNAFPTTEAGADTASIKVSGYTTYADGVDFEVRVASVNAKNTSIVPRIVVEVADTKPDTITVVPATNINAATLAPNAVLATGKVTNTTAMEQEVAVLNIKAYYSIEDYHITNLENTEENKTTLKNAGLLAQNFAGTLIQQDTWNALAGTDANSAYSFTIQVLAAEGNGTAGIQ